MEYSDRNWLLRRYKLHVRAYPEASGKPAGIAPEIARDEWILAWTLTIRALTVCQESFDTLKWHVRSNGCKHERSLTVIDFPEADE